MRLADGSYDAGCELFGWLEADCDELVDIGGKFHVSERANRDMKWRIPIRSCRSRILK